MADFVGWVIVIMTQDQDQRPRSVRDACDAPACSAFDSDFCVNSQNNRDYLLSLRLEIYEVMQSTVIFEI